MSIGERECLAYHRAMPQRASLTSSPVCYAGQLSITPYPSHRIQARLPERSPPLCQRPPDTPVTGICPAALLDPQHQLQLRVGRESRCPEMFELAQSAPQYRGLSAESRTSLVSSRRATSVRQPPAPYELPTHSLTCVTNGRGQRIPTRRLQFGRIVSALRVGATETTCSTLQHAQLQAREERSPAVGQFGPRTQSTTPICSDYAIESRPTKDSDRAAPEADPCPSLRLFWVDRPLQHPCDSPSGPAKRSRSLATGIPPRCR